MRLARVNYILMTLSIWILQWWSRAFLKQMSFQYRHGFIVMLCLEDNACAVSRQHCTSQNPDRHCAFSTISAVCSVYNQIPFFC